MTRVILDFRPTIVFPHLGAQSRSIGNLLWIGRTSTLLRMLHQRRHERRGVAKNDTLHAGGQECLTKYAESGWSAWVRWEWASPSRSSVPGLMSMRATCGPKLLPRSPRPALMGQTRLPLSGRA